MLFPYYSKEFSSESDRKFSFELMESAVTGTRNLKITKNQTGIDPIELNIPASSLVYLTSEMKKRINQAENFKSRKIKREKPEKKYLRTVPSLNFGLLRLRDKELNLTMIPDPNVLEEFIINLNDVKKLVKDNLKPLDPDNLSNESLYFKELMSYGDLKYQFDLTENAKNGRILKVTQMWGGENLISIDIPTEELIEYRSDLLSKMKSQARNLEKKVKSRFITSNGVKFGLELYKDIILNAMYIEVNPFCKEFNDVLSYCNTLGATTRFVYNICTNQTIWH